MYLPPLLRTLRETVRQKQIQQARLREFKALLERPIVDPISRAVHRMLGKQSPEDSAAIKAIEQHRSKLLKRTDSFRMLNLASDAKPEGTSYDVPVREATTWSQGPVEGLFLFHLVRTLGPAQVIEMGACVGISGSFIAAAMCLNNKGHLWTLEGSPEMAKLAKATFADLGLADRVTLIRAVAGRDQSSGGVQKRLAAHGEHDPVGQLDPVPAAAVHRFPTNIEVGAGASR